MEVPGDPLTPSKDDTRSPRPWFHPKLRNTLFEPLSASRTGGNEGSDAVEIGVWRGHLTDGRGYSADPSAHSRQ